MGDSTAPRAGVTVTQSLDQQQSSLQYMQGSSNASTVTGATGTGAGAYAVADGYLGAQQVEILELNGGTATVVLEGSMDGNQWYAVGFYQVDGQATLTRSVSNVSVTANSAHVYQVLDPYRKLRARISAISGASVVARAYMVPA